MELTNVGAPKVILRIDAWWLKQLAPQVEIPKPNAFELPRLLVASIPVRELNDPVVDTDRLLS